MRTGVADDGTAQRDATYRKAYDLLAEGFGRGVNGPLTVVLDGAERDHHGPRGSRRCRHDRRRSSSRPRPVVNPAGDTAVLTAIPAASPQDQATETLVHHLRDDVLPQALQGTGATSYVTGQTAAYIDISERLSARLPLFIIAVVGLSFLLLMIVFRSVLVPLKAAVMNLLSIGAAYGVVVAVFQWGWGSSLIGLHDTVPISPFLPMIMFAILFGLSMDYEVFLLSRVREEYGRTGDSHRSVVDGLAATARVITSAALIMISVFASFLLTPDIEIKMFAVGLTVAVLVDATVVRMVLVPATMALMGDANWWLPGWLDRLLPHLAVEGTVPVAVPRRTTTRTASWSSCSGTPVVGCRRGRTRDRPRRRRRGAVRLRRPGLPRRGGDDRRPPAAGGRPARAAGAPDALVAAALLHDVGHLLDGATDQGHGDDGARWLGQWFGEDVHRAGPAPRRGQALPRGDRAGIRALAGIGRDAPPPGRADGRRDRDRLPSPPPCPGGGRAPPVGRPGQGPGRRRPAARCVPPSCWRSWPGEGQMTSVLERVAAGELVVIDGGTGTEIQRRGGAMDDATWCAEANLQRPDLVREVHRAYLEAGAELIIANTFATSPLLFATLGRDDEVATIDRAAVRLAREVAGRRRGGRGRVDLDHAAGGGRR